MFLSYALSAASSSEAVYVDMMNDNHKYLERPQKFLSHFKSSSNVVIVTNRGILRNLFEDNSSAWGQQLKKAGFRLPFAFGCIFRYLFQ